MRDARNEKPWVSGSQLSICAAFPSKTSTKYSCKILLITRRFAIHVNLPRLISRELKHEILYSELVLKGAHIPKNKRDNILTFRRNSLEFECKIYQTKIKKQAKAQRGSATDSQKSFWAIGMRAPGKTFSFTILYDV